MTDTERVIAALKTVPEKNLRLIGLVNRVTVKGKIDYEKLDLAELNLAVAEAEAYVAATGRAVHVMRQKWA